MQKILNVYKPKGLTPLETINLLKQKFPEYKNEKIGYAGRLDPLAHGVLVLMIGAQRAKTNKTSDGERARLRSASWRRDRGGQLTEREKLLNLPKEYEFEAVFGVSTDTYDALGLLTVIASAAKQSPKYEIASSPFDKLRTPRNDELKKEIAKFIQSKLGKQIQSYPPYSSKTVDGKPLFQWAKENKLSEIKIPEREIEIYDFKLKSINNISAAKLKEEIMKQIASVTGDFRQKEITEKWEKFFDTYCHFEEQRDEKSHGISLPQSGIEMTHFPTARFTVSCSSGTYIRSLVNELGENLGVGAITLEILRTKVGDYSLDSSTKL